MAVVVVVVVVVVTITKVNRHTRVDAEDAEHVGVLVVQKNVCDLMSMEQPPHGIDWVEDKFY